MLIWQIELTKIAIQLNININPISKFSWFFVSKESEQGYLEVLWKFSWEKLSNHCESLQSKNPGSRENY